MSIDIWGLGLQAVNVLILIWLLSRVFWRPVAAAIVARQQASTAMLDLAQAAQTAAEAEMSKAKAARDGIAAERLKALAAAQTEAAAATKAALSTAATKAEAMQAAAAAEIAQDRADASKADAAEAAQLALQIAAKLLSRLNGPLVQSAFLDLLVQAIAKLPEAERAAIAATPEGLEIVVAAGEVADQKAIKAAVHKALAAKPALHFVTDPALLAGVELRSPHFALHNSWRADLALIEQAVHDAA